MTLDEFKKLSPEAQAAFVTSKSAPRKITYKIGDKGGLCVYGLNVRFPVTLYVEQWERLIADLPALQAFIKANSAKFTRKNG